MPGKGDELGMFKTMDQHDILIKEDILPHLEKVEMIQNDTKNEIQKVKTEVQSVKTEVAVVRNAQTSMELAILKEGQYIRELLNQLLKHVLKIDDQELTSKKEIRCKLIKSKKVSIAFIGMLGNW
ncbi:hypothetical protein [Planococcus shenhongbingii]|uniref:Uncharacterized protein n=1 Tax=Planococcus shenhongbingii TaxID=3058398 RepID=A0ABT8N7W1_9BACL|nr:hypothetical protein [Planococcus sp. N017]MDN7243970.1 hypothetical protein [Planococcus sp. N017]